MGLNYGRPYRYDRVIMWNNESSIYGVIIETNIYNQLFAYTTV